MAWCRIARIHTQHKRARCEKEEGREGKGRGGKMKGEVGR